VAAFCNHRNLLAPRLFIQLMVDLSSAFFAFLASLR